MKDLQQALNWRYAAKQLNGQTVPQEKIDRIIEAARLAPTSSGLQPFEILVISNKELKEKIKIAANNQPQITQASHVIVFAAWDKYTEERINEVFTRGNKERGLPDSATDEFRNRLLSYFANFSEEQAFSHAAKQSAIALGFALVAAAVEEVDSTPMEGFDANALDAILNLPEKGLRSTTILTLGYRDETADWLVKLKKVRKPLEQFVTSLN